MLSTTRILSHTLRTIALLAGLALSIAACDGDRPSDEQRADTGAAPVDTASAARSTVPSDQGLTEEQKPWLAERYEPASGIIERKLSVGGMVSRQTIYFDRHGAREAVYTFTPGIDDERKAHVGITADGAYTFFGPADKAAQRLPWTPDLPITQPNFNRLTPEMRKEFGTKELEKRTYLGRECEGYQLEKDGLVSRVWTWNGILLYGELAADPSSGVEPMIAEVTDLKLDAPFPESKLQVPEGMPVGNARPSQ